MKCFAPHHHNLLERTARGIPGGPCFLSFSTQAFGIHAPIFSFARRQKIMLTIQWRRTIFADVLKHVSAPAQPSRVGSSFHFYFPTDRALSGRFFDLFRQRLSTLRATLFRSGELFSG